MTLASATTRRDGHPRLAPYIKDEWLAREAAKGRGIWHPFYDWLEAPDGYAESESVISTIESALAFSIQGSASRAKRLTADRSDFWSAVGELYMAAQFANCGLSVTLGNPDVSVRDGSGEVVGIEVNAVHATHDLIQVHEMIAGSLAVPGRVTIWCADETKRVDQDTAQQIVDRVLAVAISPDTVPLAEYPDALGPDQFGREVSIADLVDPGVLRVFVQEGDPGSVATRTGHRTGYVDPWPDLVRRLEAKLPQLAGTACGIVAVDASFGRSSTVVWAERSALGYDAPSLRTDPNVAGLLVYWLDLRRHRPWRAYFVPNTGGRGASSRHVEAVLSCLGAVTIAGPAS